MKIAGSMLIILAAAYGGGCATDSQSVPGKMPTSEAGMVSADSRAPLQASIFPGDQAAMTNAQIDQVLAAKVYPPAHGRVAVVRMGQRFQYALWSEDLAALEQQTTDGLLTKIRSSPRVSDALLLPSLIVPQQMTVPFLREAAARVQADSMLVYRTFSQTYQTSRFFGGDETRAYCTVEALLLDTRTGIITTTSVATQNWSAKRKSTDINVDETVAKAEQAAIGHALSKVGDELQQYLNTAPLPDSSTSHATAQ